jgi:hypothetical protein
MAFEPINIFSNRIDPAGVLEVLRKVAGEVQVEGPTDNWSRVTALGPKRLLSRRLKLAFGHDADYYSGPDWAIQMSGMSGYFERFPNGANKQDVAMLPTSFHFALSLPEIDLNIDSNDPRLEWLYAVCRHLDGVIFTPSSLRDAAGRIYLSADGECDEDAVFPKVRAEVKIDRSEPSETADDEEDLPRPPPPDAGRVMRRAFVLAAVANRGLIENEGMAREEISATSEGMLQWLNDLGVSDELEPEEWKVLQRKGGTLEPQSVINSVWRIEGLGVLAWALGLYDLPVYDQLVSPPDLFEALHFFDSDGGKDLLDRAALRSAEELEAKRIEILMLHWRLREFGVRGQPCDFVALSKKCWFGTFDLAPYRILENDLALGDVPISRADSDLVSTVQSLAHERHIAINWLCGGSDIYSETEAHT